MSLSWLHTDGADIKNSNNSTVYLRGPAWGDMTSNWGWSGGLDACTSRFYLMQTLLQSKPTVCRCAISPAPGSDWENWSAADPGGNYVEESVDGFVNLCGSANIRIFLEFHGTSNTQVCSDLVADPTWFVNWWSFWANRYKNNPVVAGFELWNEPTKFTQAQWRTIATATYNAIQVINVSALVVVTSVPFGSVNQDWIDSPLGPQVVYGYDTYYSNWPETWNQKPYDDGDYPLGYSRMQTLMLSKNINAALPIMNTEFGWLMDDSVQACHDYFSTMNAYKNHWYCWWWWPNEDNLGLFDGGTETLVYSGQEVLEWLPTLGGDPVDEGTNMMLLG